MAVKPLEKLKVNKSLLWLSHFLNSSNSTTFMNRTNSAIAAGYKTGKSNCVNVVGNQNFIKFTKEINKWLDEFGLSEAALKAKLLQLVEAKETKFFAHEGKITDQVDVDALGIQRQALDMAIKVRGMYAPEKVDVQGNLNITVVDRFGGKDE